MARRVNKKFLTILSLVIMGGLLGAVAFSKFKKPDAGLLWERAYKQLETARAEKDPQAYKLAKEHFAKAFRADPNNIEGMVKYGDLLHEHVPESGGADEVGLRLGDDAGGDGAAEDQVRVSVRVAWGA